LTEKELKKLNRYQLLEMLIIQTERADKLQTALEEAEQRLNAQEINIPTLGSIAEASLHLKGVFDAAQKAADMYINEAKKRAEAIEEEAHRKGAAILVQALEEARRIKGENDI